MAYLSNFFKDTTGHVKDAMGEAVTVNDAPVTALSVEFSPVIEDITDTGDRVISEANITFSITDYASPALGDTIVVQTQTMKVIDHQPNVVVDETVVRVRRSEPTERSQEGYRKRL